MKVLVVKLSSLGDVIHTLPALSDAAAAVPGVRFDWVVEEAFAELPGWHPAVDRVIAVALRRWRRHPLQALLGSEWRRARAALRAQHYDMVIDAQGLLKSAAMANLVNAPCCGMDWESARERLATAAYQRRVHVPRDQHAVTRVRQLFAAALRYPVPDDTPDYGLRDALAPAAPALPSSLLFLHGTSLPAKEWPEAHWRALATTASDAGYGVALPAGSAAERTRAERIARDTPGVEVLPPQSVAQLARRLSSAAGAVAVDTGLGHLAAALAVPAVSLYGPTRPQRVGTWGKHQRHLVAPLGPGHSNRRRMASIAPEAVWRELLAQQAATGGESRAAAAGHR